MSRMKKIVASIIMFVPLGAFSLLSCSNSGDGERGYVPDFVFKMDANNPNNVSFTNTSTGEYLYLEWDYGNGDKSGVQSDSKFVGTAYYPLKGNYEVTLTLWGLSNKSSNTKIITKTIVMKNDDPNYAPPKETLVWSDEFNNSEVNMSNWTFETGAGGWGNNELQNYTHGDNAHISDGKLIITAKKVDDHKAAGSYTSTRLISSGKQEFAYGRMEVRAKLPSGTGIWPAIWMLGANVGQVGWPACGEIDIMEYVGFEPNVIHSTIHTPSGFGGDGDGSEKTLDTAEEEFHIYGMLWTETKITFYVDTPENVVHVYEPSSKNDSNWPFNKPYFFILNIAVGGNWGGVKGIDNSIFPQTMEIDYVRVYQAK